MARKKQHGSRNSLKNRKKPAKSKSCVNDSGRVDSASTVLVAQSHDHQAVCGLTNLGNTCFFNSAVQALTSAPVVRKFYADNPASGGQCGPTSSALRDIVRNVYSTGEERQNCARKSPFKDTYNPQRLFSAVCRHAPHFKGYKQHDSHELLLFLLDGLATEEANIHRTSSKDGKEEGQISRLSAVFQGQLSSTVVCQSCQYTSTTYEPFMALSLPVPTRHTSIPTVFGSSCLTSRRTTNACSTNSATKMTVKERKRLAKQMRNEAKLKRQTKAVPDGTGIGPAQQLATVQESSVPAAAAQQVPGSSCSEAALVREARLPGGSNDDNTEEDAAAPSSHPGTPTPGTAPSPQPSPGDPASRNGGRAEVPHAGVQGGPEDGGPITLQECLSAFFQAEDINWSCPAERNSPDAAAEGSLAEQPTAMANSMNSEGSLSLANSARSSRRQLSRRVSFSESLPDVKFIPGSCEQRGTDFKMALRGHMPFRRPLSYKGASLLVTADVGGLLRDKMFVRVQPYDDDDITMSMLARPMRVSTVCMEPVQDSEDEDEQMDVTSRAQLLMNCVADMVEHHGIAGLRAMTLKGMELKRDDSGNWVVHGQGHDDHGGPWQYPHESLIPAVFTPAANILTADLGSASSFGSFGSFNDFGLLSDSVNAEEMRETRAMGIGIPRRRTGPIKEEPLMVGPANQGGVPIPLGPGRAAPIPVPGASGAGVLDGKLPGGAACCGAFCECDHGGLCRVRADWLVHRKQDEVMMGPCGTTGSELGPTRGHGCGALRRALGRQEGHVEGRPELMRSDSPGSSSLVGGLEDKVDAGSGWSHDSALDSAPETLNEAEGDLLSTMFKSSRLEEDKSEPCLPASARATTSKEQLQPASKQYGLHQPPGVLWIQLKRFSQADNGKLSKLTDKIQFDFELDLSQYISNDKGSPKAPVAYHLAGVVEHSGSMKSGHYVAYIQRGLEQRWKQQTQEPPVEDRPSPSDNGEACGSPADADMLSSDSHETGDEEDGTQESSSGWDMKATVDSGDGSDHAGVAVAAAADDDDSEESKRCYDGDASGRQSMGSRGGGVQTDNCDARDRVSWYHVSDARVRPVSPKEVASCQAYLLMYVRAPA